MTAKYRRAPEVAEIAAELIETEEDHAAIFHSEVRLEFVFIDKAPQSGGRIILGRARRISGLNAVLSELPLYEVELCQDPRPFYVIEIAEDIWQALSPERRRALVDHELMHCRPDRDDNGELVLKMRPHDLEEFAGIIRRHGLWTSAAEQMGRAVIEQLALALDGVDTFLSELRPTAPPPDVDGNGEIHRNEPQR